jgi:alpha-galactosidase
MANEQAASREGATYRWRADGEGRIDWAAVGGAGVRGLSWLLVLGDGRRVAAETAHACVSARDDGLTVTVPLGSDGLRIEADWTFADDAATCRARVINGGNATVLLDRLWFSTPDGIDGLDLPGDRGAWYVYKMGFNVSARSGAVPLASSECAFFLRFPPYRCLPASLRRMLFNEGTRFSSRPGDFQSEWFSMLTTPDGGASLLAGFAGVGRNFGHVHIDGEAGRLALVAQLDGVPLDPGGQRDIDPIHLGAGPGTEEVLQGYARALAAEHPPRIRPARIWCSWYSGFYDRISESGLLANLDMLRDIDAPIDCFQLDDGYQAAIGDWLVTNDRFPGGLEPLARRIAATGYRPGIWTAPFSVSPRSRLFRAHPDWVVRDARGRPVKAGFIMGRFGPRFYYGLDTTREDVLAHVEQLYRTLREMGWGLFKIDFLTSACVAGRRRDPSMTRAQAYRRGLDAVRRGIGDDALLLSGIGPILANVGQMDIQRLGPDTSFGSPSWQTLLQRADRDRMSPGLVNNTSGSLARSFTNDILWSGDGDAILQQDVPVNEARFLATVALLLGSTTTVGHDFRRGPFDFQGVDDLAGVRGPGRVLDRAGRNFSRHFIVDGPWRGRDVRYYAILNPSNRDAHVSPRADALPGGVACDAWDYWDERPVRVDPEVPLDLPPRSVLLLVIG